MFSIYATQTYLDNLRRKILPKMYQTHASVMRTLSLTKLKVILLGALIRSTKFKQTLVSQILLNILGARQPLESVVKSYKNWYINQMGICRARDTYNILTNKCNNLLSMLGKLPFEMWWLYMGNFQIALDPFPPSVKQANVEKSPPNQPDKPLPPPAKVG